MRPFPVLPPTEGREWLAANDAGYCSILLDATMLGMGVGVLEFNPQAAPMSRYRYVGQYRPYTGNGVYAARPTNYVH